MTLQLTHKLWLKAKGSNAMVLTDGKDLDVTILKPPNSEEWLVQGEGLSQKGHPTKSPSYSRRQAQKGIPDTLRTATLRDDAIDYALSLSDDFADSPEKRAACVAAIGNWKGVLSCK